MKCLNEPLSIIALKHRLKIYYLTLKNIAVKKMNLDIFEKKMNIYKELLKNTNIKC